MQVEITEWQDRSGVLQPRLKASGANMTDAFRAAAGGFFNLFTDVSTIRPTIEVKIFCESSDSDWLFSDWINTLVFETREKRMIFSEFHIEVEGIGIRGSIRGELIDKARHPLKLEKISGAAFDGLYAQESSSGAEVSAVLNDHIRHPLPLKELWG
jgi:SHS2 domain-containing protein